MIRSPKMPCELTTSRSIKVGCTPGGSSYNPRPMGFHQLLGNLRAHAPFTCSGVEGKRFGDRTGDRAVHIEVLGHDELCIGRCRALNNSGVHRRQKRCPVGIGRVDTVVDDSRILARLACESQCTAACLSRLRRSAVPLLCRCIQPGERAFSVRGVRASQRDQRVRCQRRHAIHRENHRVLSSDTPSDTDSCTCWKNEMSKGATCSGISACG